MQYEVANLYQISSVSKNATSLGCKLLINGAPNETIYISNMTTKACVDYCANKSYEYFFALFYVNTLILLFMIIKSIEILIHVKK